MAHWVQVALLRRYGTLFFSTAEIHDSHSLVAYILFFVEAGGYPCLENRDICTAKLYILLQETSFSS